MTLRECQQTSKNRLSRIGVGGGTTRGRKMWEGVGLLSFTLPPLQNSGRLRVPAENCDALQYNSGSWKVSWCSACQYEQRYMLYQRKAVLIACCHNSGWTNSSLRVRHAASAPNTTAAAAAAAIVTTARTAYSISAVK